MFFHVVLLGLIGLSMGQVLLNPAPYPVVRFRMPYNPGLGLGNNYRSILVPTWVTGSLVAPSFGSVLPLESHNDLSSPSLGARSALAPEKEPSPPQPEPRCLLEWFVRKKVKGAVDGLIHGSKPSTLPTVPDLQGGVLSGAPSQIAPGLDQATSSLNNAQAMENQVNFANSQLNSGIASGGFDVPLSPNPSFGFRKDVEEVEMERKEETLPLPVSVNDGDESADLDGVP